VVLTPFAEAPQRHRGTELRRVGPEITADFAEYADEGNRVLQKVTEETEKGSGRARTRRNMSLLRSLGMERVRGVGAINMAVLWTLGKGRFIRGKGEGG
jgi:DNA polymerase/3'-5' exonuclease PolX